MTTVVLVLALLAATDVPQLADVAKRDARYLIDIRYATTDNFTGQKLYPVARCLLRPEVADMLDRAQKQLDDRNPGFVLMLKDCYRPESVQRLMWQVVKDTPMRGYVADPNSKTGSVHNYGAAVDLTLADAQRQEIDMGTKYDHLGILAEPRHEDEYVKEGKLTAEQVKRRRILRDAMLAAGFKMIPNEWWHFDAWQGEALRKRYEKLDIPLDALP